MIEERIKSSPLAQQVTSGAPEIKCKHPVIETVFRILSPSIVTVCSRTVSTLYCPDARCTILLYRLFAIPLGSSDAIAANEERSTNT